MPDAYSYRNVHNRVHRERGPAHRRMCSGPKCAKQATDWAWNRKGAYRTGVGRHGREITWGIDWTQYVAACPTHARQLDRGGDWEKCKRGHPRHVGRDRFGYCLGCRNRRYAGVPEPMFDLDDLGAA